MKCPHCPVRSGVCLGESTPRMCELMDPGHPDYNPAYGPVLIETAARAPAYPPLAQQAGNALAAVGRVVAAAAKGEPVRVPPEVYRERLIICMGCEFNGARPAGVHCMKCGCGDMKLGLATEKCPINLW